MITGENGSYRLAAAITFATASELFAAGARLFKGEAGPVTLDLAGVSDADSAALAVLLGWLRLAGPGRLRLLNPPAGLRSLAQLYGVTELVFPHQ